MAFKIMLDTNIILDLTLQRSQDHVDLEKIYQGIITGNFRCYITPIIIQTTSYWLTKEKGVSLTKEILLSLLNDMTVVETPHKIVIEALHSGINDIEDALLYYTALHYNVDAFISRDKHFIKSATPKLPIYYPTDFIKSFI